MRTSATTSRSPSRIPAQGDIQPRFDITSGVWARSFDESIFKRPTQSVDVTIELLPAGDARRRPRVQGWLSLAHGDAVNRSATPAATPWHATRTSRARTRTARSGSTRGRGGLRLQRRSLPRWLHELQPRHQRDLRAGHLLGEALHAQPRRAVGSRDRRSAAGPAFRPIRSSRRSCRRLTSPASTAASCGTTSRRASA